MSCKGMQACVRARVACIAERVLTMTGEGQAGRAMRAAGWLQAWTGSHRTLVRTHTHTHTHSVFNCAHYLFLPKYSQQYVLTCAVRAQPGRLTPPNTRNLAYGHTVQ